MNSLAELGVAADLGTRRVSVDSSMVALLYTRLVLLEILGALVLVHQSPLMVLTNALFVNQKAPPDQGIIGFLSINPFF